MNKEAMARMSSEELDEYGKLLGLTMKVAKSKDEKAAFIERRREKVANVHALGLDLQVPVKRMSDKRVTDITNNPKSTDDDLVQAMTLILGEEQFGEVMKAVTEEDGTVDVNALGYCFSTIITSDELKNF